MSEDPVNWARAFLSSSLLSLQIYPDLAWDSDVSNFRDVWLGLKLTGKLLRDLSSKCHRLRSLRILPGNVITTTSSLYEYLRLGPVTSVWIDDVVFSSHFLAPTCFTQLNFLREIWATPAIIEVNIFQELGELPFLESLSIQDLHVRYDWKTYANRLELPAGSFPALRQLDLLDLTCDSIINICRIQPLAQALRAIRPTTMGRNDEEDKLKFDRVLALLAHYNSPVSHLGIHLSSIRTRWIMPEKLSGLKLTHLCLPEPLVCYDWSELVRAVPTLESFKLTCWIGPPQFSLKDLRPFATSLPYLCQLHCPLSFLSIEQLGEHDFIPPEPQSLKSLRLEVLDDCPGWIDTQWTQTRALASHTEKIATLVSI